MLTFTKILQVLVMLCLLAGYALAHPQAPGWAGIWQNGMWTSPDEDMDNIPVKLP
jgi:hypothetical protein